MEAHKLSRTPSSLVAVSLEDPPDPKPHKPSRHLSGGAARGGGGAPLLPLLLPLPFFLLLFLSLLTDRPFLHNLIFASAGLAVASVILRRHRLFRRSPTPSVLWFIGDDKPTTTTHRKRVIVREGVEFYSNGDCYEGEFHMGRCSGSGVHCFYGRGRYEGDWIDGKYDGYGVETWARGSRYRGQYRQGLRNGMGVYRFYNGDSYAGEWLAGQSHGVGAQSCFDGSCYAGEFKHGIKHGLGCYYFRNGDRYSGEYFADKIHGFGVYHFANGHCYEGSWHEGRKQGYGMYTFRNGEARSGDWDYGVLKNPLLLSNPEVERAVQAARKAAESATLVPRVDEQVNKAVGAANRAANAARVAAIKAVQNRMDGKFCNLDV